MGENPLSAADDHLALAQQIAHMGSFEWNPVTNVVTWSDELYRIYGLEPRSVTITLENFLSRVHAEDRARIQRNIGEALERGGRFAYEERIVRPDGTLRHLDTIGEVLRDGDGRVRGLIGTCRDVTEERRARKLQRDEQRVLEMIASGEPLRAILETLVRAIEEQAEGTLGSILLLEDGKHVRHIAAPSLPAEYLRAIDGQPIGPRAGSCGTAAFRREPVFVVDIANDDLWADYRDVALRNELRACWSMPMVASDGRVLGTFALYYREPRVPTKSDVALIERAGHLAGIAIERRQLEDQLRALTAHVESVREDERSGIAREIHDELGQTLTALRMDLAWIGRRLGERDVARDALLDKVRSMTSVIDGIVDSVRRISAELRPGLLDDLGLVAAVEWQCEQFQQRTDVACIVRSEIGDAHLSREVTTALFRILQEALTNVARHAKAQQIDVTLSREGQQLRLEIHDDGCGMSPETIFAPTSLGLLGIRERARRLGGAAAIRGEGGTTVTVLVPFEGQS